MCSLLVFSCTPWHNVLPGFFSSRAPLKNRSTIFTLGNRDTVITTELEDPIIVIPQAQKTEKKVCASLLQCSSDVLLALYFNDMTPLFKHIIPFLFGGKTPFFNCTVPFLFNGLTPPFSPLQFPYEALFRSVHYAVMDHACREFLFIVDFFKMPVGGAMEIFKEVMGRTLEYLQVPKTYNLHYNTVLHLNWTI